MGIFGRETPKQTQYEHDAEAWSNLQQAFATIQGKVERMKIARTPEGMLKMADEAARQIEDVYARGGLSRDQRLLNITTLIRRKIAIACDGEAIWSD